MLPAEVPVAWKAKKLSRPKFGEGVGETQFPSAKIFPEDDEVWHGFNVAFSPDGRHLAVTHNMRFEAPLAVWRLGKKPELAAVRRLGRDKKGLGWVDNTTVALGWKGGIALYDPFRDELVKHMECTVDSPAGTSPWNQGAFSAQGVTQAPDGAGFAAMSRSEIAGFDNDKGLWRVKPHGDESVTMVAWHPDGDRIFSGGTDRWLRVWNAKTGAMIEEISQPPSNWLMSPFTLSPDGQFLVSRDRRFGLEVRAAPDWKVVRTLEDLGGPVACLAWGPGNRLAIGTQCPTNKKTGGGLAVWSTTTWKRLDQVTWKAQQKRGPHAHGLAWSADGKHIAVVDFQGDVRVLDAPAPDAGEAEPANVAPVKRTGKLLTMGKTVAVFLDIQHPEESTSGVLGWYDHDFSESGGGTLSNFSYGASFAAEAKAAAEKLGVTEPGSAFVMFDHMFDREPGPFAGGTFVGNFKFSRE